MKLLLIGLVSLFVGLILLSNIQNKSRIEIIHNKNTHQSTIVTQNNIYDLPDYVKSKNKVEGITLSRLDRERDEVGKLLIEMRQYIKDESLSKEQIDRINGQMDFAKEVLQKIANLRRFYDGSVSVYEDYDNSNDEDVIGQIKKYGNDANNMKREVLNSMMYINTYLEYVEVGTREKFGRRVASEKSMEEIGIRINNINKDIQETDRVIRK
jgi:hypothetical protein